MKKLLCLDATLHIRRVFHATNKGFKNAIDTATGEEIKVQDPNIVVIAFLQSLLKKVKELDYQYEVVCLWDRGSWKYRPKEKFTEYKSNRVYDETFQCCWDATNIAVELVKKLGMKSIQIGGLEADDLGMYFSHLPNEVILYTNDSDWRQALTHNTTIHTTKGQIITIDDILKDQITTPFDIAISKAINAEGHDNLTTVIVEESLLKDFEGEDKHNRIISAYKKRQLPQDILDSIDRNMQLSKLDRILYDDEVKEKINAEYNYNPGALSNLDISLVLSQLGDYPVYFNGVLKKYNSIHNGK